MPVNIFSVCVSTYNDAVIKRPTKLNPFLCKEIFWVCKNSLWCTDNDNKNNRKVECIEFTIIFFSAKEFFKLLFQKILSSHYVRPFCLYYMVLGKFCLFWRFLATFGKPEGLKTCPWQFVTTWYHSCFHTSSSPGEDSGQTNTRSHGHLHK